MTTINLWGRNGVLVSDGNGDADFVVAALCEKDLGFNILKLINGEHVYYED